MRTTEPLTKESGTAAKPPPVDSQAIASSIQRSAQKHGPELLAMLGDSSPANLELPEIDFSHLDSAAALPDSTESGERSPISNWQNDPQEPALTPTPKSDEDQPKSIGHDASPSPSPAPDSLAKTETSLSSEPPARLRERDQQRASQQGASGPASLGNVNITAEDEVDFDLAAGTMVFRGNAAMEGERFNLKSDRIEVGMQNDQEGMQSAVAVGNVTIQMVVNGAPEGYTGYCERAIYNPDDGSITLTGWPEIIGNGGRQVAATPDTKVILYGDGRLKTYGRNKTYLSDR
jgi:lipopolysaccharide transport protein LptA